MWTWWLTAALAAPTVTVATIDEDIVVDGVLDEPGWALASPVEDFVRYLPSEGGPPGGTTEVRFLQDDRTLYIGIRVTESPQRVRARLSFREDVNADDQIGLYLDPFGDAQVGYIFYTNARGVQQDIQWVAGEWNTAWGTVYRTKGTVTDDGYVLEIALPFRSIKYPAQSSVQDWGLILTRKIPGEGAKYAWPRLERNHPWLFAQAGKLRGVRPPQQGSGLELIPGLTVAMEQQRDSVEEPLTWSDLNPWWEVIRPSLDVRVGLSPTLALIGTINPDFSQVESDTAPIRVNQRFAFRFAERRPFFTEGAGFFSDRHGTLYSRSLVAPLYGLKLAGRSGAWSMGVLHATDTQPTASVNENPTPGFAPDDAEDRWAVNTMVRLRRDLPRNGWVGMTLTDKRLTPSRFRPPEGLNGPKAGHDLLGFDAEIPTGKNWIVRANHAQSLTMGHGERIGGFQSEAAVARPSGDGLGHTSSIAYVSPDHRQELGFLTQSGYLAASSTLDWTFAGDGALSTWRPGVSASVFEEDKGESYRSLGLSTNLLFRGIHSLTVDGGLDERRETDPTMDALARVPGWWATLSYSGQAGQYMDIAPSVSVSRGMDFRTLGPALRVSTQLDATIRPITSMRLDLLARWIRFQPELRDPTEDLTLRGRLQVQFTRQWGLRLISQYNLFTERAPQLESSALLSWLLHPFTAAYVGYAERTELGAQAGTLDRAIFAKVQVMIRP